MRIRHLLLADLALIALATFGAFVLRFDWWVIRNRSEFIPYLIAALLLKPVVFYAFGLYRRYWRYASFPDLVPVLLASACSLIVMGVFVAAALPLHLISRFSRAVVVTDGVLTLLAVAGVRLSVRALGEARARTKDRSLTQQEPDLRSPKKVLVVGAGDAGTLVVREMQRNPQLGMKPVGFLDDDPIKIGKDISGVPVVGSLDALGRITAVDEVVIAMPSAAGPAVRSIVQQCRTLGLPFQTMPGVFELLGGTVGVSRLRDVDIADLLRRRQVKPRPDRLEYIKNRTVLITGAGGSIGSELCRQVAHLGPSRLVLLGHGENSLFEALNALREHFPHVPASIAIADIRNRHRLDQIFDQFRPEIIFHVAAYKHVPIMEEHFEEAITNNVVGTMNVIDAALLHGVQKLVSVSTDKAVFPRGFMGAAKRMADILVKDAAARSGRCFVVVRFGNVLGSRGSVVPFFKQQIERGGPVTVTHAEMTRFFMTISEAAHLVLQAGGMGAGGELFVLNMGEPVRILDLARDIIQLSGFTTDQIPIVITGMRPGEKLTESLWEDDAMVRKTEHADVLMVLETTVRTGDPRAAVAALEHAALRRNRAEALAILREWIPTFEPLPQASVEPTAAGREISGEASESRVH